jgi:hypothetical protein
MFPAPLTRLRQGAPAAAVGDGLALLVPIDAVPEPSTYGRSLAFAVVLVVSLAGSSPERSDAQELRPPQWSAQWPLTEGRGVCFAYSGWCPITGSPSVGEACYGTIASGVRIYGTVTAHWYRGHVSPDFNFHTPPVPSTIR